ncbi:MAG: efflux RND transporter periplasmic adaptor subunit [Gammaproteobacteria bacterium]|nr:efflux RND transporter periplasmic adaptor subunit [Gammaproteobacteria bacterium]
MKKLNKGLWVAALFVFPLQLAADADIPVSVKSFKQLAIYPVVHVPASVVSLNNSKLSAEVNAVIENIAVDVGQTVERGSVLLQLDSSYYQLEFDRSKAALQSIAAKRDLAEYQLQRAKRLSNQKVVSEELLKQRESDLKALTSEYAAQKASRDIAKRNLDKCTIKSPFKAIVKERLGHVGELASIGTPLIHIVDAEHLEVSAKIQSNDVVSLSSAKQIELVSQGGRFNISLKNITPAYDSFERSQEVRFSFVGGAVDSTGENKTDLPGAFGKIEWQKSAPHIPADLTVRRDGDLGIFILKDNKSKFIKLTNAKEGQPVEQSQLPETVSVIVDGRYRVEDGSVVKVKQQ